MARTPSMTTDEAEAVLGSRGALQVTQENRGTVRKWLVAQGFPALFAGGLSMRELEYGYNDRTGAKVEALWRKLRETQEEDTLPEFNPPSNGDGASNTRVNLEAMEQEINGATPVRVNPIPQETPQSNGRGSEGDALALLRRLILVLDGPKAQLDADAVREIVRQEIENRPGRTIRVEREGYEPVKIDGAHPAFERVAKLLGQGANVLLVGPAGCGKTHLCEQIAKALSVSYGAIHGSAGASESALTGWLLPGDGGRFEYVPAPFVNLYEQGNSLFCFDELDAFDPNMLLVVNGALANGHIHVAHRRDKPCVAKGKGTMIVATANTYGTGGNPMYAGRSALDAATLDRFVVVEMDYDVELEKRIAVSMDLTESEMNALWELRKKVREAGLRRAVSTRAFIKAGQMKAIGDDWNTIIATLTCGWTKDEKAKAGM